MMYLDPKSDVAFKKLFGDATHKNILISLLNSVLERVGRKTIVDVVMNDPHNLPETTISKTSIVDLRCTDQDGNQHIVEMQVMTQKDYAARAQYYSALALGRQLGTSQKYSKLVPVIFLGILDFKLFEGNHYVSHHLILDKQTGAHELKHLEFHFIELAKFDKQLDDIATMLDKWIYFLKYTGTLQTIPASFKDPVLKEAFDILAQSNWSTKELEAYDRYLDEFRSSASQLETAEERGIEKGEKKATLALAKEMLSVLDVATVARMTGLSPEEIEKLKK